MRDRAAFAFALASAAVGLDVADGRIRAARVALGGVLSGLWIGLFVGLIFALFASEPFATLLGAVGATPR